MYRSRGFTIVELMIVVVVIGVLAAIIIVAYSGITTRAENQSRLAEMKAWEKMYKMYYTLYGQLPQYPGAPDGQLNIGYCLGTGFPDTNGDGIGNCRDLYAGPPFGEQENAALNTELAKVTPLPKGPRNSPGSNSLGPFAMYYSNETIVIYDVFKGTACPDGTSVSYQYPDNQAIICNVTYSPV
jgi:prepilin-type N-terminal cleavage/methylation domain-containing protein